MGETWLTITLAAVIGLVTGWIADPMTGRRHGLISTLATGLVGSYLGLFVVNVMETGFAGRWTGPAASAIGAVFLLTCLALVRRKA
jgi:uncharacterized membrane protein YeaQ/YmgE (transglycosylase-associated protein family)